MSRVLFRATEADSPPTKTCSNLMRTSGVGRALPISQSVRTNRSRRARSSRFPTIFLSPNNQTTYRKACTRLLTGLVRTDRSTTRNGEDLMFYAQQQHTRPTESAAMIHITRKTRTQLSYDQSIAQLSRTFKAQSSSPSAQGSSPVSNQDCSSSATTHGHARTGNTAAGASSPTSRSTCSQATSPPNHGRNAPSAANGTQAHPRACTDRATAALLSPSDQHSNRRRGFRGSRPPDP